MTNLAYNLKNFVTMKDYRKTALNPYQQIELLKSQGLVISDSKRVKRHLSNVNYYRISAYMLPYKLILPDGRRADHFYPGVSWDDVYDLYKFDRKLRLLVFDAIERIEVALRAQLIYQLSQKYGGYWLNDRTIFKPTYNQRTGKEYSIFDDINSRIAIAPCWESIEWLYFSELSRICLSLKSKQDVKDLASYFGVHNEDVFCSWLHSINYVRNVCAHHGRLWNINLAIQPAKYKNPKSGKVWLDKHEMQIVDRAKMYYFMCVLLYLLQTVNPGTKYRERFMSLLQDYPNVNIALMGFEIGWESHPLWKKNYKL